jgi:hypothetical protein
MQLSYGNFSFDPNSTEMSSRVETLWNSGGQPYAQRRTLKVTGYLSGNGQDALIQQESALRTALSVSFSDLLFVSDSGQQSPVSILGAGSTTGVQIHSLEFSATSKEGEYTTVRNFSFVAEAEYPLANSVPLLLAFRETITVWGGGPIWKFRMAVNGPPQKQLVYPQSIYYATQQGELTGYLVARTPPPPLWPGALMHAGRIGDRGPDRKGFGHYQGETITWQYDFEASAPFPNARPNVWIK